MYLFTYYIEPILVMIFCIILIIECVIIIKLNIRTHNFEKEIESEKKYKKIADLDLLKVYNKALEIGYGYMVNELGKNDIGTMGYDYEKWKNQIFEQAMKELRWDFAKGDIKR